MERVPEFDEPWLDPESIGYQRRQAWEYFRHQADNRRFNQWRRRFFPPNDHRCDWCYVNLLAYIDVSQTGQCAACALRPENAHCSFSTINPGGVPPMQQPAPAPMPAFNPAPAGPYGITKFAQPGLAPVAPNPFTFAIQPPGQAGGSGPGPAGPALPQHPAGPAPASPKRGTKRARAAAVRDRCDYCERMGLDCDKDGTAPPGIGCTACRKRDERCDSDVVILPPRPDGMVPPLCCSECLVTGGIKSCSWRFQGPVDFRSPCAACSLKGVQCTYMGNATGSAAQANSTHYSLTQTLPVPRGLNEQEQFGNPVPSAVMPPGATWVRNRDVGGDSRKRRRKNPLLIAPAPLLIAPAPPVAAQAPPPVVQANPPVVQAPPAVVQAPPAVVQANPPVVQAPPAVVQAPPAVVQAPPAVVQAPPAVVQAPPAIVQAPPAIVQAPPAAAQDPPAVAQAPPAPAPGGNKRRCQLCLNPASGNVGRARCAGIEGVQTCRRCATYGLVCSINGVLAPPLEGVKPVPKGYSKCDSCRTYKRPCDRSRPCNACQFYGSECTGQYYGCFVRDTVPGADMVAYFAGCGWGSRGIGDDNYDENYIPPPNYHLLWRAREEDPNKPPQPLIVSARLGEPDPQPGVPNPQPPQQPGVPPQGPEAPPAPPQGPEAPPAPPPQDEEAPGHQAGASPPVLAVQDPELFPIGPIDPGLGGQQQQQQEQQPMDPQLIDPQLVAGQFQTPVAIPPGATVQQVLNSTLSDIDDGVSPNIIAAGYGEVLEVAKSVIEDGGHLDLLQTIHALRTSLNNVVMVGYDETCQQVRTAEEGNRTLRAIIPLTSLASIGLPADWNVAELANPTMTAIRNATITPIERPPSPGPPRAVYSMVNDGVNVWDNQNPHPNPKALSVLRNVALNSEDIFLPDAERCMGMTYRYDDKNPRRCDNLTNRLCEDKTHDTGEGSRICDECNDESCQAVSEYLKTIHRVFRIFSCADCAATRARDPRSYTNAGLSVYGMPPFAVNEQDPGSPTAASRPHPTVFGRRYADADCPQTTGGFMGPALPVTGCSCAAKLQNNRLCKPHRLNYLLKMMESALKMQEFVQRQWGLNPGDGQSVCFFCEGRHSVNPLDLPPGGVDHVAYCCVACHGVVAGGPELLGEVPGAQGPVANAGGGQNASGGGDPPPDGGGNWDLFPPDDDEDLDLFPPFQDPPFQDPPFQDPSSMQGPQGQFQVQPPPVQAPLPVQAPVQVFSPAQAPFQGPSPGQLQVQPPPVQAPSPVQAPAQGFPTAEDPFQDPSPAQAPVQVFSPAQAPFQGPSPGQGPVQGPSPGQAPFQTPLPAQAPVQGFPTAEDPFQDPSLVQAPLQGFPSAQAPVQGSSPGQGGAVPAPSLFGSEWGGQFGTLGLGPQFGNVTVVPASSPANHNNDEPMIGVDDNPMMSGLDVPGLLDNNHAADVAAPSNQPEDVNFDDFMDWSSNDGDVGK